MRQPLSSAAPEPKAGEVVALREVTVVFAAGTFTAIMGPSGSGKSTLLQCAAGLDRPSSGEVRVAGHELGGLSEARLTVLRREQRVAITQAPVTRPAVMFADEPTGALGSAAGREVLAPIARAGRPCGPDRRRGHHDPAAASRADRVVFAQRPTLVTCLESERP